MHTSSVEVGTAFLLQLEAVNQLPPSVLVNVFSQPLACAAAGAHVIRRKIAASASRVVRPRCTAVREVLTGICSLRVLIHSVAARTAPPRRAIPPCRRRASRLHKYEQPGQPRAGAEYVVTA